MRSLVSRLVLSRLVHASRNEFVLRLSSRLPVEQCVVTGVRTDYSVGILQCKPVQSAKYCNLIGRSRVTELVYTVKCPQCVVYERLPVGRITFRLVLVGPRAVKTD